MRAPRWKVKHVSCHVVVSPPSLSSHLIVVSHPQLVNYLSNWIQKVVQRNHKLRISSFHVGSCISSLPVMPNLRRCNQHFRTWNCLVRGFDHLLVQQRSMGQNRPRSTIVCSTRTVLSGEFLWEIFAHGQDAGQRSKHPGVHCEMINNYWLKIKYCALNTHLLLTKTKDMLPPNIRKRGEVVLLEMEVKWPRREFDEVASCRNREFASSWWTMAADVERRVALKLPTHSLVCIDVGERLKKVWRPSPYCGGSYGRWRDRSGGRHGRIVQFVFVGVVCGVGAENAREWVRGPRGLCVEDGLSFWHNEWDRGWDRDIKKLLRFLIKPIKKRWIFHAKYNRSHSMQFIKSSKNLNNICQNSKFLKTVQKIWKKPLTGVFSSKSQ
jgi:hypothetical protein